MNHPIRMDRVVCCHVLRRSVRQDIHFLRSRFDNSSMAMVNSSNNVKVICTYHLLIYILHLVC